MSYDASLARERHRPRLPTASGLTRALACPTSCVLPQVTAPSSPWAESGRALHAYVEAIARGATPAEAAQRVPPELRDTALALDTDNWPVDLQAGWRPEVAVLYDMDKDAAEVLDAAARSYGHRGRNAIVGTADLVRVHDGTVYVIDVKTGRGWLPRPSESGQLRALALAFARVYGVDAAEVGHLRVDTSDGHAWLDLESLDALELATVREQLLEAREAVEAEVVAPKEGQWCRYCPAFPVCPAKAALVTEMMDVPVLDQGTAAAAWQRIKDARAVLDRVEAALKEYAAREAVSLPGGWVLAEAESVRESLDGRKAHAAALEVLGPATADVAVELTATKASIEEACRQWVATEKAAGRKATLAAAKRAVMDRLVQLGGVAATTKLEVKERRQKGGADA